MSYFECRLNRRFWSSKKVVHLGVGGQVIWKKMNFFFRETFPEVVMVIVRIIIAGSLYQTTQVYTDYQCSLTKQIVSFGFWAGFPFNKSFIPLFCSSRHSCWPHCSLRPVSSPSAEERACEEKGWIMVMSWCPKHINHPQPYCITS